MENPLIYMMLDSNYESCEIQACTLEASYDEKPMLDEMQIRGQCEVSDSVKQDQCEGCDVLT